MAKATKKAKAKAKAKPKAKPRTKAKSRAKPKAKKKPKAKPKSKPKPKPKVKAKAKPKPAKKKAVRKPKPKPQAKRKPKAKPKPKAKVKGKAKRVVPKASAKSRASEAKRPASPSKKDLIAKLKTATVRPEPAPEPELEKPQPPAPPPVSPVSRKDQLEIREKLSALLEQLQENIQGGVKQAGERDLAHIMDTSDMAADSADGELAFRIAESEGANATEVQKAIEKIDTGSYGICERCSCAINIERLQFLPYATHCIKCQELSEIRRKDDDEELDDLADAIDEGQDES